MARRGQQTRKTVPAEIGPVNKEGSQYVVRYVEVCETRTNKTISRRDKADVENERKKLLKRVAASAPSYDLNTLPPNDGTSTWWKNTFSAISDLAIKAANDGQVEDQKKLLNLSKTIATLSAAALPHAQVEQLEAKLEQANKFIAEIQRRNITENATQLSAGEQADSGVRRPDGPEDPLLRDGDPVQGPGRPGQGPPN